MVIVFDKTTKEIHHTENNVMYPALPQGTFDDKKRILAQQNLDFVGIPYEMGEYIFNFNLCFDMDNNFTGLQPKIK
jgi:hypothetical protein